MVFSLGFDEAIKKALAGEGLRFASSANNAAVFAADR
jgi:hypothetical protein